MLWDAAKRAVVDLHVAEVRREAVQFILCVLQTCQMCIATAGRIVEDANDRVPDLGERDHVGKVGERSGGGDEAEVGRQGEGGCRRVAGFPGPGRGTPTAAVHAAKRVDRFAPPQLPLVVSGGGGRQRGVRVARRRQRLPPQERGQQDVENDDAVPGRAACYRSLIVAAGRVCGKLEAEVYREGDCLSCKRRMVNARDCKRQHEDMCLMPLHRGHPHLSQSRPVIARPDSSLRGRAG